MAGIGWGEVPSEVRAIVRTTAPHKPEHECVHASKSQKTDWLPWRRRSLSVGLVTAQLLDSALSGS